MSNQRRTRLVDQDAAIRDYLDALLRDVGDDVEEPDAVAGAGQGGPTSPAVTDVGGKAEPRPEQPRAPARQAPDEPPPAEPDVPPAAADTAVGEEMDAPGWIDAGAFQALFFTVGGLKLAIPLTELHSVVPARDVEVTPMPNQPEWQRGLMRYRERNVRVIDTATMVLPPDKRDGGEARAEPAHILVVGDGTWGLACHAIGDVIRLTEDEVKWRRAKGNRPWLAGTVIGHLSALVDAHAFTAMLQQSNRR